MADNKNSNNHRNDAALIIGICLVLFGVWKLAEHTLSPWWPHLMTFISQLASYLWPIAIIVAGVFVIIAVRKGTLSAPSGKRLYRSRTDKKIAGVCGGLATFFSCNVTPIRIIALILLLLSFFSIIILYVILWIVIPEEPVGNTTWV
jgi:phage shock protein PspC (stress-responsive transcriptional regulator)